MVLYVVEKRASCYVKWEVKDFFSSPEVTVRLWTSPSFYFSDTLWCLQLYSNFQRRFVPRIGIYLKMQNSLSEAHKIFYRFGVKASDGTETMSWTGAAVFNESNPLHGCDILCELKALLPRKRKLSPCSALTFFCHAHVVGEKHRVDAETQTDCRDNVYCLSQNFKDLFLNEAEADVTIKVKDREFRAHSQILSARSPVFAAMFRHDTKEKNTGIVNIQEYDPDAFREFLMFLYSGQAEELSLENVTTLYSAADKYDIENLKSRCSELMKTNMSVDSFCRFHHLAITYDDKDLIEISRNFFDKNVRKILVTDEWKSFVEQYTEESNELFIRIAERYVPD